MNIMKSYKEWKNKENLSKIGDYEIVAQDIGNNKVLISISLNKEIPQIDSKKEIKKIIDTSELYQLEKRIELTGPTVEPYNNRDSRPAPGF